MKLTANCWKFRGVMNVQELSLKREYKSIGQAVNIYVLGDWEAKIKEYLADLQTGLDSLDAVPVNDEERQEIFEIKKQIVSALVKRITIDRNRDLQVEISINLLNLSGDNPPPKDDPDTRNSRTPGPKGKNKDKIKPAGVYPGWRYFFRATISFHHI
ncbi:MAG TPA: hypothetical protein VFI68_11125 [Anaerolineales bacterium]|nr:hypothetical protein [Anaerolineales bacterium]